MTHCRPSTKFDLHTTLAESSHNIQPQHTKLSPALLLILRSLLHLHSIIDHKVHEFVKTLDNLVSRGPIHICKNSNPDSSLNSDRELLIEPYLNRRVLLKELEDEIDWWE